MNTSRPKRVAAIHDLSSFGRCSLSVISPVLSALSVQVCPIPAAIMPTHTGGFFPVSIQETSNFVENTLDYFNLFKVEIDCVYSGFLAGASQMKLVEKYIHNYPSALIVVDPVLGDGGKPYQTVGPGMIEEMKNLIKSACIITPNATEAALLTGREFSESFSQDSVIDMINVLSGSGPETIVLTGVVMDDGKIYNFGYSKNTHEYLKIESDYYPAHYPGTGDIFCSVLTGHLLNGKSLAYALSAAAQFIEHCVKITYKSGEKTRDGIFLEPAIRFLFEEADTNRIIKI